MRELVGRLEALDPDVGAALRAVTYFDQLVEQRAGLENVVRGASVLSGHPAVLIDAERGLRIRVEPDGTRNDVARPPGEDWCRLATEGVTLYLEHPEPASPVEAVVLERATMAARTVLDRTRSRGRSARQRDDELLEVLLDPMATERDRTRAAQILGLSLDGLARVVATVDGRLDVEAADVGGQQHPPPGKSSRPRRAGLGPAVRILDLPRTVETARIAARFTAEGTPSDPGPQVVHADELGGLLLLGRAVDTESDPVPDVVAVEKAASAAPWMLTTLQAVSSCPSLRAAATALSVHHSTLQERLSQAERVLGWSVRDLPGHTRLTVALMLRRLDRNRTAATSPARSPEPARDVLGYPGDAPVSESARSRV